MTIQIAPSLLSADFGRLADEVRAAEAAGGDLIHVDVMDGRFVPNLTIGPVVVQAIKAAATRPLDVHLMIVEPERYIDAFAKAGSARLYVHAEATVHLHRAIQQIRSAGVLAGVALNPHTPLENLDVVLEDLSAVLLMTVNPGFGGQAFIPAVLPRIAALRATIDRRDLDVRIAVDGGIAPGTAAQVCAAGADVLVAGAAVFGAADYAKAIAALRAEGEQARAGRVGRP